MKGKKVFLIRWEERILERIKKQRPHTITAPLGMDLHIYGYNKVGNKKSEKERMRWEEGSYNRTRRNEYYHKSHPNATFYYKE